MRILTLQDAVRQIRLTAQDNPKAFFFMAGAGISYPEVPLAGGIVEHCRKRIGDAGPQAPGSPMTRYAQCFEDAYPGPADRQKYLRGIIEGKQVSQANLRLAHLLISRKLPRLVVTTNFDDFLSRALTLFGEQPAVCEHPETILKIDPNGGDIQIVHVHGTYWFYDCKNLPGEIKRAARRPKDSQPSMRGFLDELLGWRSPLVVGYSGWEGDVFMTALKQRLRRTLRYNIYWFCYRRADLDGLPDWLTAHANVRLVCPDEAKTAVERLEKSPGEGTQSAREVFDELLRGFEVEDAEISKDPFSFYLDYFNKVVPKDESGGLDTYFRGVIERFESVVMRAQATGKLEELRSKIRTAQYREAVGVARQFRLGKLSVEQLRELVGAMEEAAQGLFDDSDEELAAYEIIGRASEKVWEKSGDRGVLAPWALALINRGRKLVNRGRHEEAITVFDELVRRFDDQKDVWIAELVASALNSKGVALGQLCRSEEEITVYEEVVNRFGESKEPGIAERVARALFSKGVTLGQLGRSEEAVVVYDEVVRRFGEAKEVAIAVIVQEARSLAEASATTIGDSESAGDGGSSGTTGAEP